MTISDIRCGFLTGNCPDRERAEEYRQRLIRALCDAFPGANVQVISRPGVGSRPKNLNPWAASTLEGGAANEEEQAAEERIWEIMRRVGDDLQGQPVRTPRLLTDSEEDQGILRDYLEEYWWDLDWLGRVCDWAPLVKKAVDGHHLEVEGHNLYVAQPPEPTKEDE